MSNQHLKLIKNELKRLANPVIAAHSQGFFKTAPGEYGEGDIFLGIRMPAIRKLVKQYKYLTLESVLQILKSKYHEERILAVLLLVELYDDKKLDQKEAIYNAYLKNTRYINNWDLVDASAHKIVGPWLENRDRKIIYRLADSNILWERRIAMICCFHFIRQNDYADTLNIAELLLQDSHDLMHKAVGWMLREIGNRDLAIECKFLNKHYQVMPRTMLRYAIEKFPEKLRLDYLKGRI